MHLWIGVIRQRGIVIPLIDGIGSNPVVQVPDPTLIRWRQHRVGAGPRYLVRIPHGGGLRGIWENRRVVRSFLRADCPPDGAGARDGADYEPSIPVLHIFHSLRLKPAHENQYEQNHDYHSESTARVEAPVSAVRPGGQCADEKENDQY